MRQQSCLCPHATPPCNILPFSESGLQQRGTERPALFCFASIQKGRGWRMGLRLDWRSSAAGLTRLSASASRAASFGHACRSIFRLTRSPRSEHSRACGDDLLRETCPMKPCYVYCDTELPCPQRSDAPFTTAGTISSTFRYMYRRRQPTVTHKDACCRDSPAAPSACRRLSSF